MRAMNRMCMKTHVLTGCSHYSPLRGGLHESLDRWAPLDEFFVRAEGALLPVQVLNGSVRRNVENSQSLHIG
jgi:hypothetical protein